MAEQADEGDKAEPASLRVTASSIRATVSRLYEIDVVRVITALSVVGVHTVTFTVILNHTSAGIFIQNAVVSALHFTREIFLAISAFVLVYSYTKRPFSTKAFWKKRGIGVLLPYVVWSIFYEAVSGLTLTREQWTLRTLSDLATGSASFQLYYILLTLELYLVLPWVLAFIKRAGRHPWLLLGCSLALQVVLMVFDYRVIQVAPFDNSPLGVYINLNQTRFLPLYQFYVVLGGVAALKLTQIRAFLLRYGAWTIPALVLTLCLLWGNLVYQTGVTHMGIYYGIAVFQPVMPFFAIAVCACLYWIAYRYAIRRAPRPPRGFQFWSVLSSASFGIYLLHAYILNEAMLYLVPNLPVAWLEPLRVVLTWVVVAGLTAGICSAMLYVPLVSRLIGHPCMWGPGLDFEVWLAAQISKRVGSARALVIARRPRWPELPVGALASPAPSPAVGSQGTGPMAATRLAIETLEVSGASRVLVPPSTIELSGAEDDAATR